MQTIALEQLDPAASQWLRQARQHESIVVTEGGTPILTVTSTTPQQTELGSIARRVLLPGYAEIMNEPIGGIGITTILERDREDRW